MSSDAGSDQMQSVATCFIHSFSWSYAGMIEMIFGSARMDSISVRCCSQVG
jgi:hypothetical protein